MSNRQTITIAPRVPESQAYFTITNAGHQKGLLGKRLVEAGALGPGTYECEVVVEGMAELAAHLRCSAVTGTVAPVLETRYLDGTQRTAASGAVNFVATTQQALSLTDLKGQKKVYLVLTIASGESLTFDRAEFNGQ